MPDNQDEFAGGFTRETLVAFRKAMAPDASALARARLDAHISSRVARMKAEETMDDKDRETKLIGRLPDHVLAAFEQDKKARLDADIAALEKQLEEHKRTCPECQSDTALEVMCAVALDLVIKMFELDAPEKHRRREMIFDAGRASEIPDVAVIHDADGLKLENVVWCDTLSGEAVHQVIATPEEASSIPTVENPNPVVYKRYLKQYKAPLTVTMK